MKKIGAYSNTHSFPSWSFKFPRIVLFWHRLNRLVTLRYWYVVPKIKALVKDLPRGAKVLEVGSGSGEILFTLPKHVKLIGLDMVKDNIQMAESISQKLNRKVEFINQDFLSLEDEKFDLIYMVGVLQAIPNFEAAMNKIQGLAQVGSSLALYIPIREHSRWKLNQWLSKKIQDADYVQSHAQGKHFPLDSFNIELESRGFSLDETIITYGIFGNLAYQLYLSLNYLTQALPFALIWVSLIWWLPGFLILFLLYLLDILWPNSEGRSALILATKQRP